MIYAIENNFEHRCNGELALHVLDMIGSTIKSAEEKNEIQLQSPCEKPKPFLEEEIKLLLNKI